MFRVSSFIWTGTTWAVFEDPGKIPCSNDWLVIKLSEFDKILTLPLRIITGIPNEPKAFPLFNWDNDEILYSNEVYLLHLCRLVWVEMNSINCFWDFWMVYLNQECYLTDKDQCNKLLKALAMSEGLVISLPFTLTMFK